MKVREHYIGFGDLPHIALLLSLIHTNTYTYLPAISISRWDVPAAHGKPLAPWPACFDFTTHATMTREDIGLWIADTSGPGVARPAKVGCGDLTSLTVENAKL